MNNVPFHLCERCGKSFAHKNKAIKYCSSECRSAIWSANAKTPEAILARAESLKKALLTKNKNQLVKRVIKNCITCGKQMNLPPSKNFRINCSRKCYGIFQSQFHTGERAPFYIEGKYISGYGPRWHKVRKEVKLRDNYTCKFCGSNKNIHVHHIDENKKNNAMENLITICSPCHLKLHGPKQNRRPL